MRLTPRTRFLSWSLVSTTDAAMWIPAAVTSTSIRPNCSSVAATVRATACSLGHIGNQLEPATTRL